MLERRQSCLPLRVHAPSMTEWQLRAVPSGQLQPTGCMQGLTCNDGAHGAAVVGGQPQSDHAAHADAAAGAGAQPEGGGSGLGRLPVIDASTRHPNRLPSSLAPLPPALTPARRAQHPASARRRGPGRSAPSEAPSAPAASRPPLCQLQGFGVPTPVSLRVSLSAFEDSRPCTPTMTQQRSASGS